jgi:hypothetical protein
MDPVRDFIGWWILFVWVMLLLDSSELPGIFFDPTWGFVFGSLPVMFELWSLWDLHRKFPRHDPARPRQLQ